MRQHLEYSPGALFADCIPVTVQIQLSNLDAGWARDGDERAPDRLTILLSRSGDTSCSKPVGRAKHPPGATRHLLGHASLHCTARSEQFGIDPEDAGLQIGCIRHDASPHRFTGPGHLHEPGDDQSPGE